MPRNKIVDTRRFRRRPLRILVDYVGAGGLGCDYATSLSDGGLYIETESQLPLGSQVKVRFRLPDRETLHEIEGRVCWANAPQDCVSHHAPGVGVEFTDGDAADRLSRELEDLDTR